MNKIKKGEYFLPYQKRWLNDDSAIKIWEKSRRIGATYVQSYEDVRDCIEKKVQKVWFSSADMTAGREYIDYCAMWAKVFNAVASNQGEVVIDEKGMKAFALEFSNGAKIYALSSNPTQFRSKGGKVVIDEFAFHDDQERLWAAARPCITWGYPLRIISTHNGKNCKYFQFVDSTKRGELNWSLHTTPIQTAVQEGLADKIAGKKLSEDEKQNWLEEERKNCGDEFTWRQEYCCEAVDEATAFLTYELIHSCEQDTLKNLNEVKGELYLGYDVARKNDLPVITVLEKLDNVYFLRQLDLLTKMTFAMQEEFLFNLLELPNLRRACIDSTGLGMHIAENAQTKFGKYKVEAITFTNTVKADMAYKLLEAFQDKNIRIPNNSELREDLHSIKKITTSSGNIRFDAEQSKTDGHADRFWSLALALHAGSSGRSGPAITKKGRLKSKARSFMQGFRRGFI